MQTSLYETNLQLSIIFRVWLQVSDSINLNEHQLTEQGKHLQWGKTLVPN